jgi:hypothetical protein
MLAIDVIIRKAAHRVGERAFPALYSECPALRIGGEYARFRGPGIPYAKFHRDLQRGRSVGVFRRLSHVAHHDS